MGSRSKDSGCAASVRKVVEVVLDEDDRGALVAAAAGEVAQRADQVGEAARGGALRVHAALEVAFLLADAFADRRFESKTL